MDSEKRLTGIIENVKAHVGSKPVIRDKTHSGKSRIFFDVAVGVPDEKRGVFATWRHCIAYGENADNLNKIGKGSYVELTGFIETVAMRDKSGEFVKENDIVLREEKLICLKTKHVEYNRSNINKQLPLESDTLAPVGQAS